MTQFLGIASCLIAPRLPNYTAASDAQEQVIPTKFLGQDYRGEPVYMPLIGAGTWQFDEDAAYESVCKAFGAGYTFVDTAYGYRNQKGVGRAIKDCWKGNRTDLFVMTKIPGECDKICEAVLERKVEIEALVSHRYYFRLD